MSEQDRKTGIFGDQIVNGSIKSCNLHTKQENVDFVDPSEGTVPFIEQPPSGQDYSINFRKINGTDIDIDTSNFDGELDSEDNTLQKALDSIDDILFNKMNLNGDNSYIDAFFFNTVFDAPSHQEGVVFWDKNEHTISIYNDSSNVTHQLGQELLLRVYNNSGATINNGTPVYISGSEGTEGRPTIEKGKADVLSTANIVGLTTEDILNNSYGYVTLKGLINDLDTSSFSVGETLYLSTTVAGGLTTTQPTGNGIIIQLGTVIISAVSGRILVSLVHLGEVPVTNTKTVFYRPERVGSYEDYKVKTLAAGANDRFTFIIPSDFNNLISLEMVYIPSTTIVAGKTIDLTSDYAGIGELSTTQSESSAGITITGTANTITSLDISSVFSSLEAGDFCGLFWTNNSIGTTLNILAIRLEYN